MISLVLMYTAGGRYKDLGPSCFCSTFNKVSLIHVFQKLYTA